MLNQFRQIQPIGNPIFQLGQRGAKPSFDLPSLGYGGGVPAFGRTKLPGVGNPAMLDSLFGGGLAGRGYGNNWVQGFLNQARNNGTSYGGSNGLTSNPQQVQQGQPGQPQKQTGGVSYGYKS